MTLLKQAIGGGGIFQEVPHVSSISFGFFSNIELSFVILLLAFVSHRALLDIGKLRKKNLLTADKSDSPF